MRRRCMQTAAGHGVLRHTRLLKKRVREGLGVAIAPAFAAEAEIGSRSQWRHCGTAAVRSERVPHGPADPWGDATPRRLPRAAQRRNAPSSNAALYSAASRRVCMAMSAAAACNLTCHLPRCA